MSQFDPNSFLDATLSEPTERRDPLPVENPATTDKMYTALVGEIKARAWQGREDPTKSGIAWDVPLEVQVPSQLQQEKGLPPTITVRDSIMLDLTPGGTIDNAKGKNNRLRMYRDAVDLNKPGDKFSARLMQSKVVKIKINHEVYQGNPQERVGAVMKA